MSKLSQLRKKLKKSKWLYEFEVKDLQEVEETEDSVNEKGEKVSITRKIKKVVPVSIKILRPSRKMYDKAELYYGVKLSEGIKAGLLTKALLAKRYEDDGGSMSEREKEEYFEAYYALLEKENEYQRLQLNLDNVDPQEKDKLMMDALYEILDLRRDLREIEEQQSSLFNQTAENRAKNQVLMWWVLQLGFVGEEPLFTGSMEEREEQYEVIEDAADPFLEEAVKKLAYFISFWYSGQAEEKEDFDRAAEIYTSTNDRTELEEAMEEEGNQLEEAVKEVQKEELDDIVEEAKELKSEIEEATKDLQAEKLPERLVEDEEKEIENHDFKNAMLDKANAVEGEIEEEIIEEIVEVVEETPEVGISKKLKELKKEVESKPEKPKAKKKYKKEYNEEGVVLDKLGRPAPYGVDHEGIPYSYPPEGSLEEQKMKENAPSQEVIRDLVDRMDSGVSRRQKEEDAKTHGAKLPPSK